MWNVSKQPSRFEEGTRRTNRLSILADRYEEAMDTVTSLDVFLKGSKLSYDEGARQFLEDLPVVAKKMREAESTIRKQTEMDGGESYHFGSSKRPKLSDFITAVSNRIHELNTLVVGKNQRLQELEDKIALAESSMEEMIGDTSYDGEEVLSRFVDELEGIMDTASDSAQSIDTLGSLHERVKVLRERSDRVLALTEKKNDINQELEKRKGMIQDLQACVKEIYEPFSKETPDVENIRWVRNLRARLENYGHNDWQLLAGTKSSLIALSNVFVSTDDSRLNLGRSRGDVFSEKPLVKTATHKRNICDDLKLDSVKEGMEALLDSEDERAIERHFRNGFSQGWIHNVFRAKAMIDTYFRGSFPRLEDAIDQAEAVLRTVLHLVGGEYVEIDLLSPPDDSLVDVKRGMATGLWRLPGVEDRVKNAGGNEEGIVFDVVLFPHKLGRDKDMNRGVVHTSSPAMFGQ